MNRKEHIKSDLFFLGYTIPEVHKLIDNIGALNRLTGHHRRLYHNWNFIKMIKENYGKKALNVALLHILIDLEILGEMKTLRMMIK